MKACLAISLILANNVSANDFFKNVRPKTLIQRSTQETVQNTATGVCSTMIPPSVLPPDNSSCWQWWEAPADGILPQGSSPPPTGCDYKPCEDAVCACDSYCCDTAWDLSCRGYQMQQGDILENNYFEVGCSARILCCEPETAYPKPPVGAALPGIDSDSNEISASSCQPGSPGCCDTMVPPSYLPPDDSTCWQWWDPPADGVMQPGSAEPPKGCNYKPCESAVCGCDSYCCETAWDLSCRGYEGAQGDSTENNYFVDKCSAKLLCCEPESAYPDPPVGGANPNIDINQLPTGTGTSTATATFTGTGTGTSSSTASVSFTEVPTIPPTGGSTSKKGSKKSKGTKGPKGSKGKGGTKGPKSKGKAGTKGPKSKGKAGTKGPKSKGKAGTKGPKSKGKAGKGEKKGSKSSKKGSKKSVSPTTTPGTTPTAAPTQTSTSTGTFTGTTTLTGSLTITGTNTLTSTSTDP